MYRQYEDPRKLEKQLAKLKERYAQTTDELELMYLAIDIHELEERVNFAWQDEEYDRVGDCAMYMTLHLIAVEKSFIPEEINEIFVISYLHGDIHPDIRQ
jgi:hypothetical protein